MNYIIRFSNNVSLKVSKLKKLSQTHKCILSLINPNMDYNIRESHESNKLLALLLNITGCKTHWHDVNTYEPNPKKYWQGCTLTLACGKVLKNTDVFTYSKSLLKPLKSNDSTVIPNCDISQYRIKGIQNNNITVWTIQHTDGRIWNVEAKLVLTQEQVNQLVNILTKLVPPGTTCSLQADTHNAGSVFVGMICTFNEDSIPIVLVSADIGCGLAMIPISKNGKHIKQPNDTNKRDILSANALITARRTLKRGRDAESGAIECTLENLKQVIDFYMLGSTLDELCLFLNDIKCVLDTVGVLNQSIYSKYLKEPPLGDLSKEHTATLKFICRYAMTLGSSGNHFLEMCKDSNDYLWWVVHSGSRALGAMVYKVLLAVTILLGNPGVASGPVARFYAKAYDTLNKFARFNRALCAIAVSEKMGFDTSGETLRKVMLSNPLFKEPISVYTTKSDKLKQSMNNLAYGLTHNGIKSFKYKNKIIFICQKGAIAISDDASCAIVALKAGEGNYFFSLANPDSECSEITIQKAYSLLETKKYELTTNLNDFDNHIILAGHGAGRKQSAGKTWGEFAFQDLVKYFTSYNVVGNLGPNVLGDHPDGYKYVKDILGYLPLNRAITHSQLKTIMSFKEGIDNRPVWQNVCSDFFASTYLKLGNTHSDMVYRAMYDLILCKNTLNKKYPDFWSRASINDESTIDYFARRYHELYHEDL